MIYPCLKLCPTISLQYVDEINVLLAGSYLHTNNSE